MTGAKFTFQNMALLSNLQYHITQKTKIIRNNFQISLVQFKDQKKAKNVHNRIELSINEKTK